MDVPLESLGNHLEKVIADKFKKERMQGRRILEDMQKDFKLVQDFFMDFEKQIDTEKDDLLNRALTRFINSMKTEMEKYPKLPESITHADLKAVSDFSSRFLSTYNENGRKWVPKFGKEMKNELKSMDILMNRFFRNGGKLDAFTRKSYVEAKAAEDINEKIQRLKDMVTKLQQDRAKVDQLTAALEQNAKDLTRLEHDLLSLEDDPLVAEQNKLFRTENAIKQEIQLELSKLKKSMKKFLKAVEDGEITLRFIVAKDIKDYFKSLFESLIADGPEYPKLRAILENLEGSLEDDIQLKDDKKSKTQGTISAIKDNLSLKPLIEEYTKTGKERQDLSKRLQNRGTEEKIAVVKIQFSDITTQKSHNEADLHHEKEGVVSTLTKMKNLKESVEEEISKLMKGSIKILLAI
nr:hypothetical protein [Candidatus Sigynarchaeota archaeon]